MAVYMRSLDGFRRAVFRCAAVGVLIATACTPAAQPQPGGSTAGNTVPLQPDVPQVLRIGNSTIPPSLDPASTIEPAGTYYAVYDTLTWPDAQGKLQPSLSTSWKLINDTTWQFTLRPNIKFQNGDPFNADQVKYSYERVLDPATKAAALARILTVKSVEVVDPMTVNIITKDPDPILPKRTAAIYILSKQWATTVGADINSKSNGTGPFKVDQYVPNDKITMSAWTESWRKVKLTQINIKVLPELATRMAALRTNEVDIIGGVDVDSTETLKRENLNVVWGPVAQTYGFTFDTLQGPMMDKRVRQAINYAVDKESMVKVLRRGFGRVEDGQMVQPETFGYNPSLKAYPFDVAKAKQLLAEAGYPNGFETKIGLVADSRPMAEAVAGYLAPLGIKAEIVIMDFSAFRSKLYDGGREPIFAVGWNNYPAFDADFALVQYRCDKPATAIYWCNADFDAQYQMTLKEMDPAKREKEFQQASAIMREEAPYLFLYQNAVIYGVRDTVSNFKARPDTVAWYDDVSMVKGKG